MKRDADLFGSSNLPIPPSCLITIWADLSCNPKIHLSHPVTLTEIICNTRKINISRFLETSTTGIIYIIHYYYYKLLSTDSPTLKSLLEIKYRIVIQQIIQSLHLIQVSIKFHVLY